MLSSPTKTSSRHPTTSALMVFLDSLTSTNTETTWPSSMFSSFRTFRSSSISFIYKEYSGMTFYQIYNVSASKFGVVSTYSAGALNVTVPYVFYNLSSNPPNPGCMSHLQAFLFFCCVVLCCVVLCFVLFCFVLFCFVLFCFVLFCFVLFCFVLFCFVCLTYFFPDCKYCFHGICSAQSVCVCAQGWQGPYCSGMKHIIFYILLINQFPMFPPLSSSFYSFLFSLPSFFLFCFSVSDTIKGPSHTLQIVLPVIAIVIIAASIGIAHA